MEPTDDRRSQILAAALQTFGAKGFRGATNRDIAQAAGIAPGLLYWYFKNKGDLFNAVIDAYIPFHHVQIPLHTISELSPEVLLPAIVRQFGAALEDPTALLCLRMVISESITNPAIGERFNILIKRVIDPLSHYMQVQIERGRLRPAEPVLMVQALISPVGLFFIRRIIGQDPDLLHQDLEVFMQFVVETFLRAFAPEPTSNQ